MRAGRGAAGSVWPGVRSGECGLDRENGGKEVCSSVCVCGGEVVKGGWRRVAKTYEVGSV